MLARSARLGVSAVTLLLLGCSGASAPGGDSPEAGQHADAATPEAASRETGGHVDSSDGDASDAGSPAADAAPEATVAEASSTVDSSAAAAGPCASCTAMMCPTELEACAGSEPCTDALVAFNDCFTAPSLAASCGATFATAGAEASAMWSCMSTTCKPTCG